MFANLTALFIDQAQSRSDELTKALGPEIYFIDSLFCDSLSEGLGHLLEKNVQICFIGDGFPPDEFESFLRDIKNIPRMNRCVVTLVKETLAADINRGARAAEGVHAIISRQATTEDKHALNQAIEAIVAKGRIIDEKVHDVEEVLGNLIQQVDDVAMDRKRGVQAKFNSIVPRFVKDATNFDSEVLDNYYDALSETLEEAQSPPVGFESIEVPDHLLNGKYPKLGKNSYYGASRRLWKKLSERWARRLIEPSDK